MTTPSKTSNDKLVSAMRILAGEIESPDGVANMAIGEGADRIEELAADLARVAELEEKAERYRLTTLRQDARIAEMEAALREMVDAQDATVEQFTAAEIDRLEKAMRRSREILARAQLGSADHARQRWCAPLLTGDTCDLYHPFEPSRIAAANTISARNEDRSPTSSQRASASNCARIACSIPSPPPAVPNGMRLNEVPEAQNTAADTAANSVRTTTQQKAPAR